MPRSALFLRLPGIEGRQPPLDRQGDHEFVPLQVDRLEVAEHPGDDLGQAARGELKVGEGDRLADDLRDATLTARAVEQGAGMERVDEDRRGAAADPQHEMRRQVHPRHLQAQPPGQGAIEDREADRDPRPAIDHLVQVAVPRVAVVLRIPLVSLFNVEDPVDLAEHLPGPGPGGASVADAVGQGLDLLEVGLGVEVGVLVARDLEGDPGQVGPRVALQELEEFRTLGERRSHARPP